MTFEPLIRISPLMMVLLVLLIVFAFILFLGFLGFPFFVWFKLIRKYKKMEPMNEERRKDIKTYFLYMLVAAALFGTLIGGVVMSQSLIIHNEGIVRTNVSQKYAVDELTFAPRGRDVADSAYPAQSEAQKVTIKTSGKSILAILTQDKESSEPTLFDFDTGEPLDNLLKNVK